MAEHRIVAAETERAVARADPAPTDRFQAATRTAPTRLQGNWGEPFTIHSARFKKTLDEEAGARFSRGNRVTAFLTGKASFDKRAALMLGAQQSIHLQTFTFDSDETGMRMATQLAARARAGVKVRVIYDAFGSLRADSAMFAMMKQAGVELRKKPLSALNHRWHEKHFVVDGREAISGGMNIGAEYAYGGGAYTKKGQLKWGWRDKDVHVQGPAVGDLQFSFLRNWAKLGPDVSEQEERVLMRAPLAHSDGVEMAVVQSHPLRGEKVRTTELLYYAFAAAERAITIETPYFLPPKDTLQALIDASERGVRIRVITNSRKSTNHTVVNDSAEQAMRALLGAGVEIYESPGMVHAKTATVDGELTLIGSANLNGRSHFWDGEDASAIWDKKTAGIMQQHFEDHLPVTHFMMEDDLGHHGFLRRAFLRLARAVRSSF